VLICSGGVFLAFLDLTVVNLALPAIGRDFPGTSVSTLSWVVTAYAVLFGAALAPAGRLADAVGRRRIYLLGLWVFTIASLGCALAPGLTALSVLRAIQGGGAALIVPASLGLALKSLPASRMREVIAIWSAAGAVAAALGPSLGGVLISAFGWRSVFVANLPFGIAIALAAARTARDAPSAVRVPDWVGSLALVVGVGGLVTGISEAPAWGWGSWRVVAAIALGTLGIGVALVRSWRVDAPAIETRLWRVREFAMANAMSLLFGAALGAWLLCGVLFLTEVWHYHVFGAGLAMTPGAFTGTFSSFLAGKRAKPDQLRPLALAGAALLAADAVVMIMLLDETPRLWTVWVPTGLVAGIALGVVITALSSLAVGACPPASFAAGLGLNMTARQIGAALGLASLAGLLGVTGLHTVTGFHHVYFFVAAVCTALTLLGLAFARPSAATSDESPAA
jgi:EmrB/QacA subfamily drug resistance transporter